MNSEEPIKKQSPDSEAPLGPTVHPINTSTDETLKRKRGRPRKQGLDSTTDAPKSEPIKRNTGQPKKNEPSFPMDAQGNPIKRKRETPKKYRLDCTMDGLGKDYCSELRKASMCLLNMKNEEPIKRKQGRPRKQSLESEAPLGPTVHPIPINTSTKETVERKRGRPRKQGPDCTTDAPMSKPSKRNTGQAKKEELIFLMDIQGNSIKRKHGKPKNYEPDASMNGLDCACCKSQQISQEENNGVNRNFIRTDPSYLETLGQTHHGWIFGAIAELVDNSMDASATKLGISVGHHYSEKVGEKIPMLSFIDDGHGMSHEELIKMLSLGHKRSSADDRDRIERLGIGFKTGAMKLGRDVIVLTQTTESRCIAFLSQSLNVGNNNIEIPIVSCHRNGTIKKVDSIVQSEATANCHLKAIKDFSPFNEYLIVEKLAKYGENGHGTQIYIWNLEKCGSDFCLEWETKNKGKSSPKDDILVRSRRIRPHPGQISQKVPLDYSLRSFLEVIYLNPRMKIYVQGSLVKSHPLAKSLNMTEIMNGMVMGKPVKLTLGRCQREWEWVNCGIFLYWHGRLIEAYKRVGAMVHNKDIGRGLIGVIDVTNIMSNRNDIHNSKQEFVYSEAYMKLEEWLGHRSDEYWGEHCDVAALENNQVQYKPDNEWVQCDKCRKWRKLKPGIDTASLPQEWFCHTWPYHGNCGTPEEELGPRVVNVGARRMKQLLGVIGKA